MTVPDGLKSSPLCMAVNLRDPEENRVVLYEENHLKAVRWGTGESPGLVGNVYLGTILQVEKGLDAVFVDIGEKRAAFLHLGNVHPAYGERGLHPTEIAACPSHAAEVAAPKGVDVEGEEQKGQEYFDDHREGAQNAPLLSEVLEPGDPILVQVQRDPVRGKGATLTTFLSLAGRFAVLFPSLGRVGVSRRILENDERTRLRDCLADMVEEDIGIIARTASLGLRVEDMKADVEQLKATWNGVMKAAKQAKTPMCLWQESSPVVRAVRELLSTKLQKILVDDSDAMRELSTTLKTMDPKGEVKLEFYEGKQPLFEFLGLERDWQMLFRSRVPIGSGASIVIHETEALTAIDVNSGRLERGSLEETAFETNCLAAGEAARQIQLRDLGGILVLDFIDMKEAAHRRTLEFQFRDALSEDRSKAKVGAVASFGLMSMTRRRQGFGLPKASAWMCRGCGGSGSTGHHQAGYLRILRKLRSFEEAGAFRIRCQPGVAQIMREQKDSISALPHQLEIQEDPQVPSGEPVVERLAAPPQSE